MDIKVRELLEFIRRNPRLAEYDASILIVTPKRECDEVPGYHDVQELRLGDSGGQLVLEVVADA